MQRSFGVFAVYALSALLGCSSNAQARQCPENPENPEVSPAPNAALSASASPLPPAVTPAAAGSGVAAPTPTSTSTESHEALPELKLKITGMHIGGGPNDAETKRPFMTAIEAGFDPMRLCYQKVEEPGKGGTFGVDLRIEREGGHPKLQAVRTAMKGDGFRACLEQAFQGLTFDKPVQGATVLSASVYFELTP